MISDKLKAYLQDWLDWVERGAPDWKPYYRVSGLRNNTVFYDVSLHDQLHSELMQMFNGKPYPFGFKEYYERSNNATQHLDPNRIAWVREQLAMDE